MLPLREGHLEILFEVFVYLKLHSVCMLLMDPWNSVVDDCWFNIKMPGFDDWNTFCKSVVDELPPIMPEP